MRITREEDYMIRIIRCLSDEKKITTAQTISEREHIPKAEVFKLIRKLKESKLVEGKSGIAGGYILAVDLKEITLFKLFNMLNKDISINECLKDQARCSKNLDGKCNIHRKLMKIQNKIVEELKNESIYEILYGK